MKLAVVSHYEPCNATRQTYGLERQDVVNLNGFFRATCVTSGPVGFPREDRPADRMVLVEFYKAPGYMGYVMPVTEYRRLMRTSLVPGFG